MALPDIWHYYADTGVLIGPGKADPSPLDPPGTWLIPAYATELEPPAVTKDKEVAVFNSYDNEWTVAVVLPTPPEINIDLPEEIGSAEH